MIGPLPHLFAVPVSVLWVGLQKSTLKSLDVKNSFAELGQQCRCGRYFEIPCKLYCLVRVCRYSKNLDIGVHIFVRYLPASLKDLGREINTANTYLGLIRSMF
jgi:hypothetical protein